MLIKVYHAIQVAINVIVAMAMSIPRSEGGVKNRVESEFLSQQTPSVLQTVTV